MSPSAPKTPSPKTVRVAAASAEWAHRMAKRAQPGHGRAHRLGRLPKRIVAASPTKVCKSGRTAPSVPGLSAPDAALLNKLLRLTTEDLGTDGAAACTGIVQWLHTLPRITPVVRLLERVEFAIGENDLEPGPDDAPLTAAQLRAAYGCAAGDVARAPLCPTFKYDKDAPQTQLCVDFIGRFINFHAATTGHFERQDAIKFFHAVNWVRDTSLDTALEQKLWEQLDVFRPRISGPHFKTPSDAPFLISLFAFNTFDQSLTHACDCPSPNLLSCGQSPQK